MFISPAYAQTGSPGGGDLFVTFVPLLIIFAIFYFLLIRPQQKRMQQHRDMVANIKRGDTIVTAGGIVGKVYRVKQDDAEIEVEIAENTRIRVVRYTISEVRPKGEAASEST
ncbi:MAG: preprotein translocase subunit YajC [Pseudomonadota bacterium]